MRLGSDVAVAVANAGSYSSDWTLAWELPCAMSAAPKSKQKKKKLTYDPIIPLLDIYTPKN